MLILVAQGQRPMMFADIAMRKALHAGEPVPVRERRRWPGQEGYDHSLTRRPCGTMVL
jgi:hypothetical protein